MTKDERVIELQNCVSARIARYEPHWSLPGPHGAVLPSFQHVVVDADAIARPPSSATRCIVIVCYIQRESRNAWTRAAVYYVVRRRYRYAGGGARGLQCRAAGR